MRPSHMHVLRLLHRHKPLENHHFFFTHISKLRWKNINKLRQNIREKRKFPYAGKFNWYFLDNRENERDYRGDGRGGLVLLFLYNFCMVYKISLKMKYQKPEKSKID